MDEFLKIMPVGYMTPFSGNEIPQGFVEVKGQRLIKADNVRLYNVLKGIVVDEDIYYVLPTQEKVSPLFNGFDSEKNKIIIKVV